MCKKAQTKTRNLLRKGYTLYRLIHHLGLNKPFTIVDVMLVSIGARRGETTHAFLKSGHIERVRPLFSVSFSGATTKLSREPWGRGGGWSLFRSLWILTSTGSWKSSSAARAGVRKAAQIIDALTPLECSVPDLKQED